MRAHAHWTFSAGLIPVAHDPAAGRSVEEARRIVVARYLRPRPEIEARVDEFVTRHFGPGPMLGVYLRGLDKIWEERDLENINAGYPEVIAQHLAADPEMKIFLMTDSEPFARWCRQTYRGRIVATSAQRADGTLGLHFMEGDTDRSNLGVEVLVDTLIAARCDRFLGLASSNVSVFVRDLKLWPAGTCELFGYPHNDRPNPFVKTHPPSTRVL